MDPKKILKSIKLPTLSKRLYEIIELDKRDSISHLKEIKNIVEKDPLLSTHILKAANSSLYGLPMEVHTISHAAGLLGVRKILSIAFSFFIFDFFKKVEYQPEFSKIFNLMLKKIFLFSAVSAALAKKSEHLNSDESYISGLLGDVGQIILFLYSPKKYREIYSTTDRKLIPGERQKFKTDHIELGIEFCEQWNLPAFIKTGIKNHFELGSEDGHSKICFISNQIAELLLTENEEAKKNIFMKLENHSKQLLHLSLPEVEEILKTLPQIMEVYVNDFPEVQKDLNKIVEVGSSFIITSKKKELDLVILAKELTDSQNKLAKGKIFLSHIMNLSDLFSSLTSPRKTITSLVEYFESFVTEFTIEFIYKIPGNGNFLFITGKEKGEGIPLSIHDFDSLVKARISKEVTPLETGEMKKLNKAPGTFCQAFPISYQHNFFGFLLLNVDKKEYLTFDLEMFYVQIMVNIIAYSFQNYYTLQDLKKETKKRELVFKELLKFDKKLVHSKKILLQSQKSEIMGEMLPVIFHKLKNKLTPILGYSQVLLTKVEDTSIHRRIKKIEKNANDLSEQLNLLRDYFEEDKQLKEKENLNRIINNLKPYFSKIEAEKKIKINLDLGYGIPGDSLIPGQIECMVTNMVDNAVHAIKEKKDCEGLITIKSELNQGGYTLTIRDNGIGIEEKDISLIWVPFYSGFHSTAGLGLAICEKIISNHEGSCSVESRAGEYTEFKINFKIKPSKQEKIVEPIKRFAKPGHGEILIVTREEYLADLMKETLMNEDDFNITTFIEGVDPVELINSSFDLTIVDLRVPEINGMNIYDFLKSKKMETKMIAITGNSFSDDMAIFIKDNKIAYLKEPFQLMEFKKRVLEKLSQG